MSELRDDVLAAVEAVRGGGGAETSGDFEADTAADVGGADQSGADAPDGGGAGDGAGVSLGKAGGAGDGGREASDGAASSRPRDASGRFAPKAAASPTEAPKPGEATPPPVAPKQGAQSTTQAPPPATQTSTPPPEFKPPQSWKPEAREHFAKAPPQVQAEVIRREREVQTALQETAGVRRFAEQWQRTLAPYEAMLRTHGQDPLSAVGNALQSMHALYGGPPQVRAKALAALIDSSGVPLELINAHWSGEPQPQQSGQAQHLDPEAIIAQAEQRVMQRFQAQQMEQMRADVSQEVERFTAEHEFAADVAPIMSGLMQRTQGLTMEAAYEQACWAHPETRRILQQRQEAERAKAVNASTQRARAAASSVKHQPATATVEGDEPETVFDAVKAAYRKHAAR